MSEKFIFYNRFHRKILSDFAGPPADFIGKNILPPEYCQTIRDFIVRWTRPYFLAKSTYFSFYRYKSLSLHQTCIYGESQAGGEITSVALKRTVGSPRNG